MRNKVKASLTVEASIILPIVIAVIILMILLFFIKCDKAVIQSSALSGCEYAISLKNSMQDIDNEMIEQYVYAKAKNNMIIIKKFSVIANITDSSVEVQIKGEDNLNWLGFLNTILLRKKYNIEGYAKIPIINPESTIRKAKIIKEKIGGE